MTGYCREGATVRTGRRPKQVCLGASRGPGRELLDFGPSPFPCSVLEHWGRHTLLLSGTCLEKILSLLHALHHGQ